jgi:hypothetical protein
MFCLLVFNGLFFFVDEKNYASNYESSSNCTAGAKWTTSSSRSLLAAWTLDNYACYSGAGKTSGFTGISGYTT